MSFVFGSNIKIGSSESTDPLHTDLIALRILFYLYAYRYIMIGSMSCFSFISPVPPFRYHFTKFNGARHTQQTHAMIVISTLECVNENVFMHLHMDWYAVCKFYTEQMQIIIITNRFNIHHTPFGIHFEWNTKCCLYLPKSVSLNRQTVTRRRRRHRLRLQCAGNRRNSQIEISNRTTVDVSWTDSFGGSFTTRAHRPYEQHTHMRLHVRKINMHR